MTEEKEKQNVSKLIKLYTRAKDLCEDLENKFIPFVMPEDIYELCWVGSKLFYDLKKYVPNLVTDDAHLTNAYLKNITVLDNLEEFYSQHSIGLRIWGQVQDIVKVQFDPENTYGNYWEKELLDLITTENGTADIKKYEQKEWWDKTRVWAPWPHKGSGIFHFLECSLSVVASIIGELENELDNVEVNQYPESTLAVLFYDLKEFRNTFLLNVSAIGPYWPNTTEFSWEDFIDTDMATEDKKYLSRPGNLKVFIITFNTRECIADCAFLTEKEEQVIGWKCELDGDTTHASLELYEQGLFCNWSYSAGEYLGDHHPKEKAYWLVKDLGNSSVINRCVNQIIDRHVLPLLAQSDYGKLADKAVKVLRNNNPEWWPGKVQWSYIKELDELISDVEIALRIYQLKDRSVDFRETHPIDKKKKLLVDSIPLEYRTKPMSISEMAGYWDIKPRKLSIYVKSGAVKTIKLGREDYIFDTSILSPSAIKALTKDGKI